MNDALFALLSNYIERASKLTGISYKTSSCIKAQSKEKVLAPLKPRSNGMEPRDFDKCEICINCKIIHKQDTNLYIIKKERYLMLGFQPLSLQKDITNVYVCPTN